MSDYDDEHNYDSENDYDENEIDDLEPNQIDNLNPNENLNLNSNPDNHLNDKKKEFEGSINSKNNWLLCMYCDKYHPNSMHLPQVNYCGHCWGWLNSDQLKLKDGTYFGPNTIDEVKNFLKLTYPLHPVSCVNNECIYNKIKKMATDKTLHWDFCVELGFVKETEKNNTNPEKKEYKLKKRSYTRINYKTSSISI